MDQEIINERRLKYWRETKSKYPCTQVKAEYFNLYNEPFILNFLQVLTIMEVTGTCLCKKFLEKAFS